MDIITNAFTNYRWRVQWTDVIDTAAFVYVRSNVSVSVVGLLFENDYRHVSRKYSVGAVGADDFDTVEVYVYGEVK